MGRRTIFSVRGLKPFHNVMSARLTNADVVKVTSLVCLWRCPGTFSDKWLVVHHGLTITLSLSQVVALSLSAHYPQRAHTQKNNFCSIHLHHFFGLRTRILGWWIVLVAAWTKTIWSLRHACRNSVEKAGAEACAARPSNASLCMRYSRQCQFSLTP